MSKAMQTKTKATDLGGYVLMRDTDGRGDHYYMIGPEAYPGLYPGFVKAWRVDPVTMSLIGCLGITVLSRFVPTA